MADDIKRYDNVTVTPREKSEVEITGAIPLPHVAYYRARALTKLCAAMEVPGFRKGHVPEKMAVEKLGEQTVLEEAAQQALGDAYPQIIAEENIAVIGRPKVALTKLAAGNPIEFKITTAVTPEVTLPEYRTIADTVLSEHPSEPTADVTDEEVGAVVRQLRENKWRIEQRKKEGVSGASAEKKPDESELPELSLDVVREFGDFASVGDFKEKIKENIRLDKERKHMEKRRITLGDRLVAETKVSLPAVLVENELQNMLAQFKHDVAALGTPFPDYLKKIGKTEEDLRNEWKQDAEKRATLQLALNAIAERENVTVPEEEIKRRAEHILSHYKNAKEESVRVYVTTLLKNEKVFQLLESTNP